MEMQINSAHTICFIGHRKLNPAVLAPLEQQLTTLVQGFIEVGVSTFLVGGAKGFDSLAAKVILRLQEVHPQIRLILVLPFEDPWKREADWTSEEIQIFQYTQAHASPVILLHPDYEPGCYAERNRYLIDHADFCLCYQSRKTGSTAYTTQYAKSLGRSVYNFAEKLKKETTEE